MKPKYPVLFILIASCLFQITEAKETLKDTLRLKMPNNVLIEQLVHYRQPKNIEIYKEFKNYLEAFLNEFEKLETEGLSDEHSMKIVFKNANTHYTNKEYHISFEDYQPKTNVMIVENQNSVFIDKRIHLLELSSHDKFNDYKALVHFKTMDQLQELLTFDFEKINQELIETFTLPENQYLKRKPFTAWINVNEDSQTELIYNQIADHPTDVLQLSAGTGLQSLKGQWLGSFNTQATIILTKKMVDKHAFSIAYEWLYNFTTPDQKYINQFIDFGYAYNFSTIPNKDKWTGISFGFITNQKGEFFEKNTFRFGLNTKVSKSISVGPQIYFNDFFKNVYPGVNISISLL